MRFLSRWFTRLMTAKAAQRPYWSGHIVTVCAWCDVDRVDTQALVAQGHEVTHGLCARHAEEFEHRR